MSLSREDRNVLLLHNCVPTGGYTTGAELAVRLPRLCFEMLATPANSLQKEV